MEDENRTENEYEEPATAETMEETDEKCPSCGAAMVFDPKTGMLLCEYCGTTKEIEHKEPNIAEEIDFDDAANRASHDWGTSTKTVVCQSCGAESIYDALKIADVCPYCGSNLVTEAGASDAIAPNGVCGFKVTVKEASENFKKWIKKKWFVPNICKKTASADAFSGVYLPFWTFDTTTDTSYTARYGIDHTVRTKNGTRTETRWYRTSGDYRYFFDDLLVPGTKRYDQKIISKIEPFDTAHSIEYKPEYLSGYIAERYSVGLDDAWVDGRNKIQNILKSRISDEIKHRYHADRVDSLRISTDYSNVKFKYLMLPIWLSSFKYKEKIYNFMVNGQTGKVGGKAPVSIWKAAIAVILGLAVAAGLIYLFMNGDVDVGFYY